MTEEPGKEVERRLQGRLRHELNSAVIPFDPEEIARAASAQPGRRAFGLVTAATIGSAAAVTVLALQVFGPTARDVGGPHVPVATIEASRKAVESSWSEPSIPSTAGIHSTGILVLDITDQVQAIPSDGAQAAAFDAALRLSQTHPEDLGYPWIDESGQLLLAAVTDAGHGFLSAFQTEIAVPNRIRDVAYSYGELQRIQNEVSRLAARGVADAQLIFKVYPDERDNRVVIAVSDISEPLMQALAAEFDIDAIAVQKDPNPPMAGTGGG